MSNYMQQAIQLAALGRYTAAPNPMVGCIIERGGKIVGRGWHQGVGFPHAEIMALNAAGDLARDANVYVNLEPCCHYGRTPPCVDALIKAQVKSVHIPFIDPNPLVNGKGIAKLKENGIEVYVGEEATAARELNIVFFHYITTKRPFVIAKWAMSLDGKMATKTGDAKWISSIDARTQAHQIRSQIGAILVGSKTVIADDPQLTVRLVKSTKHPLRIVLDSSGIIPLTAKILDPSLPGSTLIATTKKSPSLWQQQLINKNIEVLVLPENKNGQVDLPALLDALGQREISSLLVEGGAEVLSSFCAQKLINKLHIYLAAKIIGNITTMQEAMILNYQKYQLLGDDILLEAEVK